MAAVSDNLEQMPVVRDVADFDQRSGNALERLVFNNRLLMIALCAVVTVVLAYAAATRLVLNASFERMIIEGARLRTIGAGQFGQFGPIDQISRLE